MAKLGDGLRKKVVKKTCQNGSKTSTLNKGNKTTKKYRGQGR
jgi:hypothetical protein